MRLDRRWQKLRTSRRAVGGLEEGPVLVVGQVLAVARLIKQLSSHGSTVTPNFFRADATPAASGVAYFGFTRRFSSFYEDQMGRSCNRIGNSVA